MEENWITEKLDEYKNLYQGKYWNAGLSEEQLSENNWGTTNTGCYYNSCSSNSFGGGTQCYAFALFLAYILFGSKITGKDINSANDGDVVCGGYTVYKNSTSIANQTLEPGDIIRAYGHSAMVWQIGDSSSEYPGVRFVECWGYPWKKPDEIPKGCYLNWGYFNSEVSYTESVLKSNAEFLIKAPVTPTPEITVTFDLNYTPTNGAVAPDAVTFPENDKPTSMPTLSDRFGYSFEGWSTAAGNTNINSKVENYSSITENTTLYAIWKEKTMEVTYNYNINNESSKTSTETYGKKYGTDVPSKVDMDVLGDKKGYCFKGWYYGDITENSDVKMDSDHTLTAMWEPKTLTVSFDAGDGEFAEPVAPIFVKFGEAYGGLPTPKSKNLWLFDHWEIVDKNGKNHGKCESSKAVSQKADHTLRAVWKKSRTVTYILPDNVNTERKFGKKLGEKYGLPPTINREGYYVKWHFSEVGSIYDGMEYSSEMIVHPDHPTTVKGEFVLKDITLTIDYSAGFVTTTPVSVTKTVNINGKYELPESIECDEDYAFIGWYLVGENGEYLGEVKNGDEIQIGKDHTIAAGWCEFTSVDLYRDVNANGYFKTCVEVRYGDTYRFLEDIEFEGYDIKYWFFIGGSQKYHNKECKTTDIVIPEHPNKLYPYLTPKKVNVIYNANGGTYETEPASTTYDGDAVIEYDYGSVYTYLSPVKADEDNIGWFYDEECTNKCCEGDTVTNTEVHTLYAGWGKAVPLSFSTGDGASICESVVVYADHAYNAYADLPVPTKDGYIFTGWFHDEAHTDNCFPEDIVTNVEAHTLYAGWATQHVTLSFSSGDTTEFTEAVTPVTVYAGEPYGELPTPKSVNNYKFSHWYVGEDYDYIEPSRIVETEDDHTVTAYWETTRTLYFSADGISTSRWTIVNFGQPYPKLYTPTKEGYTFTGWYFAGGSFDGQQCIGRDEDFIVLPEHSDMLIARWEAVTEE